MDLELPMEPFFTACVEVLQEVRVPLHYERLTLHAFGKMGVIFTQSDFSRALYKNGQNVREKFFQRGWGGKTFYVGEPDCIGGLRIWFDQFQLFHMDRVSIPGHAEAGAYGAFDALMRRPYMQDKNPYASLEIRNRACANGKVLEAHVKRWFQETYPDFYQTPLNEHRWQEKDKDDFYLNVHGTLLHIDVMGPNRQGHHQLPHGKHATDFHFLCEIRGQDCWWIGVQPGKKFVGPVLPATTYSPVNFLVWLNCKRDGVNYKECARAAGYA